MYAKHHSDTETNQQDRSQSNINAKHRRHSRDDWAMMIALLVPVVGALLMLGAMVVTSLPTNRTIVVDDMGWVRSVTVSETRSVRHEGWELPEGATLIAAEKRPYQYVRKQFEFQGKPIYADWYTYEIDESVPVRTETTSGGKADAREWPTPDLSEGQSVGNGTETLTIHTADGENHEISSEIWDKVDIGQTIEATIAPDGRIEEATPVSESAETSSSTDAMSNREA